ncbi:MAG: alpha-L-glutamate ligase [Bacteroidota bacterium]
MSSPAIHVLYENEEWMQALAEALDRAELPFRPWNLASGQVDITQKPPEGIFFNKMSASAHSRGHAHAVDLAAAVLSWLEQHGRRVINGRRALQLELRKTEQYAAMQQVGLRVPRTLVALEKKGLAKAAQQMGFPFILKPNRGGKGLGVDLFQEAKAWEAFLERSDLASLSQDGLFLVQQYLQTPDQTVTRMEFIEGRFYYAVRVHTGGSFELCPADGCALDQPDRSSPGFEILEDFQLPEIKQCEAFLAAQGIEVAGMEFMQEADGQRYFYDVNTNTNYNSEAEARLGNRFNGLGRVAAFLGKALKKQYP